MQAEDRFTENDTSTRIALTLVSLGAGAALIAVLALVFGRWKDLGNVGQVTIVGGFTAASAAAGAWLLRRDSERLRQAGSIVWMVTVALVYGTATLVTKDFHIVPKGLHDSARAFPWLVRAVPTFAVSIVFLARQRRTAQVFAFTGATIAFALASYDFAARPTPGSVGLVISAVGALTVLLAWIDELGSKVESEALGIALLLFGSVLPVSQHSTVWAPVLGVFIGAALVVASIKANSPSARVVGIMMTAIFELQAVFQVTSSPFPLLETGAILIAGGVIAARMLRRQDDPAGNSSSEKH